MLTDALCLGATAKQKVYRLAGGCGISLAVYPNGAKRWHFRYRHAGKHTTLSLGRFPVISVEQAYACAERARQQIAQGIDPVAARRDALEMERAQRQKERGPEFRLSMDGAGRLTIENKSRRLLLTSKQVAALCAFLNASTAEDAQCL